MVWEIQGVMTGGLDLVENHGKSLDETVGRLRNNIKRISQKRPDINEQMTKVALINPILSALGWDLEDPDEVALEYRRKPKDSPVDYALFIQRTPCLFVEAKSLKADVGDYRWIAQTVSYAAVTGVEWCVLTNGDEYRLYNAHAPVDVDDKLFRTVKISDEEQHDFTVSTLELLSKDKIGENRLNMLWKAYFVDFRVKSCLERLFHDQSDSLVRLIKKNTEGLTGGDIRKSLERMDVKIELPVAVATPPGPHPSKPHVAGEKKRIRLMELINSGFLKPPIELEHTYSGQRLTAIIGHDGTVTFDGVQYSSPSRAAGAVKAAVKGPHPTGKRGGYAVDGWLFWKYKDLETGKLEPLDRLRERYIATHKGIVLEPETAKGITYCLTPVRSTREESNQECIRRLVVDNRMYAFSKTTPQKNLKPGDYICFYASGIGVIAHAKVKTSPKLQPSPIVRDTARYPYTFELEEARYYPDDPVIVDANLRRQLDAFRGKNAEKNWGWFVTPTRWITEHDFKLLTR